MLETKYIYKSIINKIEKECEKKGDLLSHDDIKKCICYFRFSDADVKVIFAGLIKRGCIKRLTKRILRFEGNKEVIIECDRCYKEICNESNNSIILIGQRVNLCDDCALDMYDSIYPNNKTKNGRL